MKVRFSQKINTRLFLLPLSVLLMLFVFSVTGFYYLSPINPFTDFHKLHLVNILSEKKLVIDTWFEQCRKSTEYLSRADVIRDNMSFSANPPAHSDKRKKRAADAARSDMQMKAMRLLEDMTLSSNCKMFALLSKDGKVISSSQKELVGGDWSDRDFFKNMMADTKSPAVRAFYNYGSSDSSLVFASPVFDDKENMTGIVYSVPNVDKLARLLQIEHGIYKTEKVEMIDRDGNQVLIKSGIPEKRIKYNIPKDSKENRAQLKDRLFYYVLSLDNAPFRLIATVEKPEVMKPFVILLILCSLFLCAILLVMLIQGAYFAPRLITRPSLRLLNAAKAVAMGNLDGIDMGKEFKGELLELKNAFDGMIEELKARESVFKKKIRSESKGMQSTSYASMSHEIKTPLRSIINDVGLMVKKGEGLSEYNKKALWGISDTAKGLLLILDDLFDLSQLEDGRLDITPEEFNLCKLIKEVEDDVRGLAGTKEIELIFDCQDTFMSRPVYTDRLRLKKIVLNLVRNAIKTTSAGTVTLLSSEAVKDGVEYIEISVADTGRGIEEEALERLFEDFSLLPVSLGLVISKRLTEALGGKLEVESMPDKGSVFTIAIPIKVIIY